MYVGMYVRTHARMHARMYVCVGMYVCMYACMHVCISTVQLSESMLGHNILEAPTCFMTSGNIPRTGCKRVSLETESILGPTCVKLAAPFILWALRLVSLI